VNTNSRRTTLSNEKVAMHRFVQTLPGFLSPMEKAQRAQEAHLARERWQPCNFRSRAETMLAAWATAAAGEVLAPIVTLPAQVQQVPATTVDEVLSKEEFVKLSSLGYLKAGLYMVRIG
jgi:2-keto-3-deoxy-galactonokinase